MSTYKSITHYCATLLVLGSVFAQNEPIMSPVELKGGVKFPQSFVIDRADVPVYSSSTGGATTGLASPPIGALYFGLKRADGRVQLGEYDDLTYKFTSFLGWVGEDKLLLGTEPVTIGWAVDEGLLSRT